MAQPRGDWRYLLACTIYGSCLVFMYGISTWYHGSGRPRWKRWLRRLDHGAIYLLIAGTYTPFLLVTVGEKLGVWMLVGVWVLSLLGFGIKVSGLKLPEKWSVASYVGLGWMSLLVCKSLYLNLPAGGIILLVAGGVAYTGGVYYYMRSHRPFHHAVWHLFVLAGSVSHFLAVLFFVK